MRSGGWIALAAVSIVAASGCGSSSSDDATDHRAPARSAAARCIILVNGNKLCGNDAVAWCDRFISAKADAESRQACRSVAGVGESASPKEYTPEEAATDKAADRRREQEAAAAAKATRERTKDYRAALDRAIGSERVDSIDVNKFGRLEVHFAHGVHITARLVKRTCTAVASVNKDTQAALYDPEDEYGLSSIADTCGSLKTPGK